MKTFDLFFLRSIIPILFLILVKALILLNDIIMQYRSI